MFSDMRIEYVVLVNILSVILGLATNLLSNYMFSPAKQHSAQGICFIEEIE
ncbi:hypothetical protein AM1BK_24070 [Neobacillus kokaensis]|uniref:Uncharacterized protein n=1 Tax=Neobacillus kokaensis TaxID=2759023 RepID=A0ABQ3N1Q3_9BACI|nr:hypothetical protein AM1BK_24070 [Neobacillus kokaensis]